MHSSIHTAIQSACVHSGAARGRLGGGAPPALHDRIRGGNQHIGPTACLRISGGGGGGVSKSDPIPVPEDAIYTYINTCRFIVICNEEGVCTSGSEDAIYLSIYL